MGIEITSVKVVKIERKGSAVIGYADIVLNECFAVHGIKILERNGKRFVAMPSRKTKIKGRKYLDLCHPIENETREYFNDVILTELQNIEEK